jgi:phosphoribosylformylglycinamidine synthase
VAARLLRSAHDCSEGGLAVALAESCLSAARPVGARLKLSDDLRLDALLFGEAPSRIVISFDPEKEKQVRAIAEREGAPFSLLGLAAGHSLHVEGVFDVPVSALVDAHRQGFRKLVTG